MKSVQSQNVIDCSYCLEATYHAQKFREHSSGRLKMQNNTLMIDGQEKLQGRTLQLGMQDKVAGQDITGQDTK